MGYRVGLILLASCLTAACGSRQNSLEDPGSPDRWADDFSLEEEAPNPDRSYRAETTNTLSRDKLESVLDQGIGHFLGRLEVAPKLSERRRFVGWRILHLNRLETSLRPGDVVVAVNQHRIERPGQVAKLWTNLRKAEVIQIDALRDGAPFSVSYDVVE